MFSLNENFRRNKLKVGNITKVFIVILSIVGIPFELNADTVFFKDGRTLRAERVVEEAGQIKCYRGSGFLSFPSDMVERIEKPETMKKDKIEKPTVKEQIDISDTQKQVTNSGSSSLSQTATRKVTIASEIKRGASAAFNCSLKVSNKSSLTKCIDIVEEENIQHRTDSDPFILGLNFKSWLLILNRIAIERDYFTDHRREIRRRVGSKWFKLEEKDHNLKLQIQELSAIMRFKNYRRKSRELGIADQVICQVIGMSFERIEPKIHEWAQKYD